MSKTSGAINITLATAHKIHSMMQRGYTQQQVALLVNLSQATVCNVLTGHGMAGQRKIADRLEAMLGGAIIGSGNTRFHAAAPTDSTTGDVHHKSHHTIGSSYEDDRPVRLAADPLAELLAEEGLLLRLEEAGISPEEVLEINHVTDVCSGGQVGVDRTARRRKDTVHNEDWLDFMGRAERDGIGDKPGAIMMRLANEGADVDVWDVRDPDFRGWPTSHWEYATTNRRTA